MDKILAVVIIVCSILLCSMAFFWSSEQLIYVEDLGTLISVEEKPQAISSYKVYTFSNGRVFVSEAGIFSSYAFECEGVPQIGHNYDLYQWHSKSYVAKRN